MSYYINLLSSTQIHDHKFFTPEHVFSHLDLKARHILNNLSFTTIHRSSHIFHNNIFFSKKKQYFTLIGETIIRNGKILKLIHFLHSKVLYESARYKQTCVPKCSVVLNDRLFNKASNAHR